MNALASVATNTPRATTPKLADRLTIQGVDLTIADRVVLHRVTFGVGPGEIVGILGPNGSGKSSLLSCIAGLRAPERGEIRLLGETLCAAHRTVKARMAVVFQESSLDPHLSALENLTIAGELFALGRREARKRAGELLAFVELSDRADDPAHTLSGGMRRRLELARALIHQPILLCLDEPTNGLDPRAFERTWTQVMALRQAQELSILITTHRPDEAEICDRIVILDRGHLVACATPRDLLARVSGDVVVVTTRSPDPIASWLREMDLQPALSPGQVSVEVADGHRLIPRLVEASPAGRIESVSLRRPTLGDVFFHLTGHPLEAA
jgi:ABC-2 type transport system ATP-binding protein